MKRGKTLQDLAWRSDYDERGVSHPPPRTTGASPGRAHSGHHERPDATQYFWNERASEDTLFSSYGRSSKTRAEVA